MATDIIHTLISLEKIDSSYDRRREIDKLREANGEYSITTTAKEVARNYSYVRENGYRDGYGFLGTVKRIDSEVKILLPTSMNEEAETWRRGEEHSFTVRFLDWDSSYKHYKLLATSVISIPSPAPPPADADHTPAPTHSEPSPARSESVLKSIVPSEAKADEGEVPEPKLIAKRSIDKGDRHEIRKARKPQKNKEPEKAEFIPQAKQLSIHETSGEPERASTSGQTHDLQQTQCPQRYLTARGASMHTTHGTSSPSPAPPLAAARCCTPLRSSSSVARSCSLRTCNLRVARLLRAWSG